MEGYEWKFFLRLLMKLKAFWVFLNCVYIAYQFYKFDMSDDLSFMSAESWMCRLIWEHGLSGHPLVFCPSAKLFTVSHSPMQPLCSSQAGAVIREGLVLCNRLRPTAWSCNRNELMQSCLNQCQGSVDLVWQSVLGCIAILLSPIPLSQRQGQKPTFSEWSNTVFCVVFNWRTTGIVQYRCFVDLS